LFKNSKFDLFCFGSIPSQFLLKKAIAHITFILIFLVIPVSGIFIHPIYAGDLAHVGIINFTDKTSSPDYQYLSESIPNAINSSMQKKFEYIRSNPESTQRTAEKYGSKKALPDQNLVRKITADTNSDIIIFGAYNFNRQENMLAITTGIYLKSSDKILFLPEITNPIDSTIFKAVDKTAAQIVEKIAKITSRQEEKTKMEAAGASKNLSKTKLKRPAETSESPKKQILKAYETERKRIFLTTDYFSNKFWRGSNFYGSNSGYLLTGVQIDVLDNITAKVSHELPLQSMDRENSVQLEPSYYNLFASGLRYFPGKFFGQYLIMGFEYKYFYNYSDEKLVALPSMSAYSRSFFLAYLQIFLPLHLYLLIITDLYPDDMNGERSRYGDLYINLTFDKKLTAIKIVDGLTLGIKMSAAFYKNDRHDLKSTKTDESRTGICDLTSGLYIVQKLGSDFLNLQALIAYILVPRKEWYDAEGNDKHQVLFRLGMHYRF